MNPIALIEATAAARRAARGALATDPVVPGRTVGTVASRPGRRTISSMRAAVERATGPRLGQVRWSGGGRGVMTMVASARAARQGRAGV